MQGAPIETSTQALMQRVGRHLTEALRRSSVANVDRPYGRSTVGTLGPFWAFSGRMRGRDPISYARKDMEARRRRIGC